MEHGFSCPQGGQFYVCENNTTEFIGCCTINPCDGSGICPKANLTKASFAADSFENIPSQNCSDQKGVDVWWTCKETTLPFLGCCSSNPCSSGACAASDLIPARLSDNRTRASVFLSATTNVTPSAIALPSNLPPVSVESIPAHSIQPAVIAAIVVSAVALIVSILAIIWIQCIKKAKHGDLSSLQNYQTPSGVVELPPTNHYPGSQWAYPNLPSQLDQQQRRASWKPYRPGVRIA
ncbi:hypothetical protein M0657_009846 [Pyricularia oryzae]|nr:hypothetical protein M0657_009846 [Pyricularia oryzae]